VSEDIPIAIAGLENQPEFKRVILENSETMDPSQIEKEVIETAIMLVKKHPDIGSIVLECHNLSPYSAAIQEKIGLPVFDIVSFVKFVHQAVVKQ
jgi:Asp/Glu/hydantoin racemase